MKNDEEGIMHIPQRGILPTLQFWSGNNQRRIWFILIPVQALVGGLLGLLDFGILSMSLVLSATSLLALGCVERYIRSRVMERRELSRQKALELEEADDITLADQETR